MTDKIALFNGCSFVWGDELQDPYASRFSKLFADYTGMREVNLSLRGASNGRIYRTTLDHIQLNGEPDLMIIVWSGTDRFEYIDTDQKDAHDSYYLQCSVSRLHQKEFEEKRKSLTGYMVDIFTDYKASIDTINYMCEIQMLCEKSNIPLLQFQFAHRHRDSIYLILNTKPKNNLEKEFINYYRSKIDYLKPYSTLGIKDNKNLLRLSMNIRDVTVAMIGRRMGAYGHPLEKSQVLFKEVILEELERYYDIRF